MKKTAFIAAFFAGCLALFAQDNRYELSDYRNYFGLTWSRDDPETILRYCKNVGHSHVMYKKGMENCKLASGMYFLLNDPDYRAYNCRFNGKKKYSQKQIDEWRAFCVVAFPEKPFPENMAKGWFSAENVFNFQADWQQQRVHEIIIKGILDTVRKIQAKNPSFKFAGLSWDVPYTEFKKFVPERADKNKNISLKELVGSESVPARPDARRDYKTYFEGNCEFYRNLMNAARRELNPRAVMLVEPYVIANGWLAKFEKDYLKNKTPEERRLYQADFVLAEGGGTDFIDNPKYFENGFLDKNKVGSSCPSVFIERDMRAIAAHAAVNGAWTAFFGRYGGYNTAPHAESIRDIPARIKVGKLVATWENLNNTPLPLRKYDGEIYSSPSAYMSKDVYWAKQPARDRIIAVFISERGEVKIPDGWKIETVQYLDGIFDECGKVPKGVLKIGDNTVSPTDSSAVGTALSINLVRTKL